MARLVAAAICLALTLLSADGAAVSGKEPTQTETRQSRQSSGGGGDSGGDCDFGVSPSVDLCSWNNVPFSAFEWLPSSGKDSYWIGGPRKDENDKNELGGYAFFETSQLPDSPKAQNTVSAMMTSPTLESTGSEGFCVTFSYAMDGLSTDKLRLLLQPVDGGDEDGGDSGGRSDDSAEDDDGKRKEGESGKIDFRNNVVLATLQDGTRGEWKQAQVAYSYPLEHKVIFEAIPKDETDQARRYRGYIALDDVTFKEGSNCRGHCTFDAGLCGFKNSDRADFEWRVGRGSDNPNTGPIRDHSSFTSNRVTGAFAYIDASSPRRPNDVARIISEEFPATGPNSPLCLRFWTHMYGSGIGSLNVYIRHGADDTKVWGLSGDAGNNWYMAQAPIASSSPFKVVFEGVVGKNSLGNIAIDDVSMIPGVCPTSPQVASSSEIDCAFEDDMCGWTNPERRDALDELNWDRVEARTDGRFPQADHTTGTREGYYMSMSRNSVQRAGDRAFFVSREIEGSSAPQCLSFWYYMYEPIVDNTGPNLGKLAVWVRTRDRDGGAPEMAPVWRLQNGQGPSWKYAQAKVDSKADFQVVVEGVWGNNRVSGYIAVDDVTVFEGDCDTLPKHAELTSAECTFDRDSCSWRNSSTGDFEWRLATLARRPANLPDKTFGAPVGYAYFDIFNTGSRSNRVKMISKPVRNAVSKDNELCFSFWFAAFGAGDTTSLRIYREDYANRKDDDDGDDDDDDDRYPSLWVMSASNLNTARPEWTAGQVSVSAASDFRLVLEGKASNGGFAIDQLVFTPGGCKTRPDTAVPSSKK